MFFLVIPVESSSDSSLCLFARSITQCSQPLWISLAGKDGINDPACRKTSDIPDNMMQLQIHLHEGFLDVLPQTARYLPTAPEFTT